MRRASITAFIEANMKGYVGVERDGVVAPMAAEIMATGVKEKDAFHTASAIYAGCAYLISTDARLLKYRDPRIKLVDPIAFVSEMEGE